MTSFRVYADGKVFFASLQYRIYGDLDAGQSSQIDTSCPSIFADDGLEWDKELGLDLSLLMDW